MRIDALGVRRLLPHRFPMALIDHVRSVGDGELVAVKAVTVNEPWYRPPGTGVVYPPMLLVESWGQAAGVLTTLAAPNPDVRHGRVMLFGGCSDVVFHRDVLPGDVVEHRVRVVRELSDTVVVEGSSTVDGEVVLTVDRGVIAFRSHHGL